MIKGPKNNPSPSHYAESNAVAIKANILWHKYENKDEYKETKKKRSPLK